MVYFETPRLVFRDWKESDLQPFKEMNKDPEVMEYFPKLLSEDETEGTYQRIQDEFHSCGYGLYAVEDKALGEFIGFIGFHMADFPAEFTPCVEIGWRLRRESWGKGFATEGALACLAYGCEELHFSTVCSFTAKINLRSERVMQKIGMKKVMEFKHPKVSEDSPLGLHVLYKADCS